MSHCPHCGTEYDAEATRGMCPACTVGGLWDDGPDDTPPDESLLAGKYRLGRKLGEGGFGVVYAAEQVTPVRRPVAVKLLKTGIADRRALTRFEAERQALAMLDHPAVARVHDGGVTEEGVPFLVMELLDEALPLDAWARAEKLSVRARISLLATACRGVEHAHARGIIHRDLKPSNVLVRRDEATGEPQVKLIDFGIARATENLLTNRTLLTAAGEVLGTPDYLSPEQAQSGGRDVDVRTDVYAVGAILYQLYSGRTPHHLAARDLSLAEALDAIRHEAPPRLEGDRDLALIAAKAMDKDRARRYAGAGAFASDLERWLRGEPVAARPASAAYLIGKWVRRHKLAAAALALALTALAGGTAVSTVLAFRARRAERVAVTASAQSDFQRAADLHAEGRADEAVAFLCQGLRRQPDDGPAQTLLLHILTHTHFPRPLASAPLTAGGGTGYRIFLTPDGRTAAAVSDWSHFQAFDAATLAPRFAPVALGIERRGAGIAGGSDLAIALSPHPAGNAVRFFSLTTGQESRQPIPVPGGAALFALSGDGKRLLTGPSGSAGLYALEEDGTSRLLATAPIPEGGRGEAALSADGSLAAIAMQSGLGALVRTADRKVLYSLNLGGPGFGAAFAPDSSSCVLGAAGGRRSPEGYAVAIPLADGGARPGKVRELSTGGPVGAFHYYHGGSSLMAVPRYENTAALWRPASGAQAGRTPVGHRSGIDCGAVTANGSHIITADHEGVIRGWLWGEESPALAPVRLAASATDMAVTPDGRGLLVADTTGTLTLFDLRHRAAISPILQLGSRPMLLAPDQTGSTVACGDAAGRFSLWHLPDARPRVQETVDEPGAVMAFDWTSRLLATGGRNGRITLHRLHEDGHLERLAGVAVNGQVWQLVISPQGRVGFGTASGHAGILTGPDWQIRHPVHLERWITAAAWSADGSTFAVGTFRPGTLRVWPENAEPREAGDFPLPVRALTLTPDGRILAAQEEDGRIHLRHTSDGRAAGEGGTHGAPVPGSFGRASFFPDGRHLLSGGCRDLRAIVWDTAAGQAPLWSSPRKRYVHTALVLSPDGTQVAAFNDLEWSDALTGRPLGRGRIEPGGEHAQTAAFSGNGRVLAVGYPDGSVHVLPSPAVAKEPAAEWLADFAERWAGARVGGDGRIVHVPAAERLTEAVARFLPADAPGTAGTTARWLLADPDKRPAWPGATLTTAGVLAQLRPQAVSHAQRTLLLHEPGDPAASLALARLVARESAFDGQADEAAAYARHALLTGSLNTKAEALRFLSELQSAHRTPLPLPDAR